jgi:hypothetical protein
MNRPALDDRVAAAVAGGVAVLVNVLVWGAVLAPFLGFVPPHQHVENAAASMVERWRPEHSRVCEPFCPSTDGRAERRGRG